APFGFAFGLIDRKVWRPTLIGFALSLSIELLQRYVIPGRFPSTGDICFNTLGTLLGALIGSRWRLLIHPSRGLATRLAILAATIWLIVIAFTNWAMYPSLPRLDYWGQLVADLGYLDPFPGK